MRNPRKTILALCLCVAAAFATPCFAQAVQPSTPEKTSPAPTAYETVPPGPQAPLRATIAPGVTSAVGIHTLPLASCVVAPAGQGADRKAIARFFANNMGWGQFFARPTATGKADAELSVRCEAAGQITTQDVTLRAAAYPTTEMPAPPQAPRPTGRVRAPLTVEQAGRMRNDELVAAGYPPAPDPENRGAYSAWLHEVTTPMLILPPDTRPSPFMRHDYGLVRNGPATSNNWSGYELRGTGAPYTHVEGTWIVPGVSLPANVGAYSSIWVGLDGDGTKDLAQAGTEQDAFDLLGIYRIMTYRAWTELLPNQPFEQVIPNFVVKPGDWIEISVWIGNADFVPRLDGGFMVVEMVNLNDNICYCWGFTPLNGTKVGGTESEWIMERPTLCDSSGFCFLTDLANFGTANVFINAAADSGATWCCGTGSFPITMKSDTGTILSTPSLIRRGITFAWSAFH